MLKICSGVALDFRRRTLLSMMPYSGNEITWMDSYGLNLTWIQRRIPFSRINKGGKMYAVWNNFNIGPYHLARCAENLWQRWSSLPL